MVFHRLLILLALLGAGLVAAVLAIAAVGADPPLPAKARPAAGVVRLPEADTPPVPAVAEPRPGLWRQREARRLRRSRTVPGALRRAWLARRLDAVDYAEHRATWARATATAPRLTGGRAAELRSVLSVARGLAAGRDLHSSRLALLFLTLRRNTDYWATRGAPVAKKRFLFGQDPVVFRYEPGQGLQVHWLGTWGRMNGRSRYCLRVPKRCPRTGVRRELDRLVGLASRRSGYDAYESLYRFGGGVPGWVSGMTQGTAVQALARARRALDAPRFGVSARRALGAFEQAPPAGVAVREGRGRHYLMYSFAPGLRILNGDLQAITGLYDAAELTGSRRARRLFRRGDRAARAALGRFDTGAWSLYSDGGRESTAGYHALVSEFLQNLCGRTRRGAYCATKRRFARYVREPPRIVLDVPDRTRKARTTTIALTLSKGSQTVVEVSGRTGVVLRNDLQRSRGRHLLRWTPPLSGRYRVTVFARGVTGPVGRAAAVTDAAKPPRRARSKRSRAAQPKRSRAAQPKRPRVARRKRAPGDTRSGAGRPKRSDDARRPRPTPAPPPPKPEPPSPDPAPRSTLPEPSSGL